MSDNERGVTLSHLLTLGHIIPAMVYVHDFELLETIEHYPHLQALLYEGGIIDDDNVLTPGGEDAMACIDMFKYVMRVTVDMSESMRPETKPENYTLLRKALGQIAEIKADPALLETLNHLSSDLVNPMIMDIGGGDGHYLIESLKKLGGSGLLIDKDISAATENFLNNPTLQVRARQINIAEDPQWYGFYSNTVDLILLNEVLHLSDQAWWNTLLMQAYQMLKPGGILLITEVLPTADFEWRMISLTEKGRAINPEHLSAFLMQTCVPGFMPRTFINNDHLYMCTLQKEDLNNAANESVQ